MKHIDSRRAGAISSGGGAVSWRVWAPLAKDVRLILIEAEKRHVCAMTGEERGYFTHKEKSIAEGQLYAYQLDDGSELPDPASRWQPAGVHAPSAVLRPENFAWSDEKWRGVARPELVFYELHVGTFTPAGTFDAVISRLPELRELGVTAVELMPIAQFPGTRNWGYDGVYPYAPQHSYGGPHGLQRLVDACHTHGLAIFLDVVYNHFGPEGSYLNAFGPYHTAHYNTPWGAAINYDDRGSDAVREYVLENVRLWIEDYHFDGLRLDAVHAIYDFGARHILRDIKESADAAARGRGFPAYVVAESDLNDPRLVLPPERGGYGLDANWSDDFHHVVHTCLTGENNGYYEDFADVRQLPKAYEETFVFNGCYSRHRDRAHGAPAGALAGDRFVVAIQNHDQIGNRALGDRLGTLISPAAQRLAASLMLLAPHLPLLFMGEEYGEENPFQFFCSFTDADLIESVRSGRRREFQAFHTLEKEIPDPQSESTFENSRLTWSWRQEPRKAGLRRMYHDLLAARRAWPALKDFSNRSARLLAGRRSDSILLLVRGGNPDPAAAAEIYFNLAATAEILPWPQNKEPLWSSESEEYHGTRRGGGTRDQLLAYECLVFGPASWQKYSSGMG